MEPDIKQIMHGVYAVATLSYYFAHTIGMVEFICTYTAHTIITFNVAGDCHICGIVI